MTWDKHSSLFHRRREDGQKGFKTLTSARVQILQFSRHRRWRKLLQGTLKGGSITVLLTSCLTGWGSAVWQLTIFVFYLQNRLILTGQTGGQLDVDTSPLVLPGSFNKNAISSFFRQKNGEVEWVKTETFRYFFFWKT